MPAHLPSRTFCARARVFWSMMAGLVLGMAHTMVTPPARAAAVPEEKSSLWVAPGSRRWTWTSMRPEEEEGSIVTTSHGGRLQTYKSQRSTVTQYREKIHCKEEYNINRRICSKYMLLQVITGKYRIFLHVKSMEIMNNTNRIPETSTIRTMPKVFFSNWENNVLPPPPPLKIKLTFMSIAETGGWQYQTLC